MKFKITKEEEIEVSIDFPIYRKSANVNCHYYRVLSEENAVQVTNTATSKVIQNIPPYHAWSTNFDIVDCTKEEFEAAYNKTLDNLIILAQS